MNISSALEYNSKQCFSAEVIQIIQSEVGASLTKVFDEETIEKISAWQTSHQLESDGKLGRKTLEAMISDLKEQKKLGEAVALEQHLNRMQEINIKAFLKFIRYAEHKREDDGVYFILYGGETFSDTTKHPNKTVKKWGKESSAAGAYQILSSSWEEAKRKGKVVNFTASEQDKYAIWKLATRGAMKYVKIGNIEKAIATLRQEWASLPGASQSKMTMSEAKQHFQKYVKEYSRP
ncbi:MAG: glycoside hydrolase family protein [Thioploca sp.]|nr:glycoside hydrolase family protein [Thioploca sp.]